ncbi:hypothetical protein OKA04_15465 [Luteolibacter flavescens]|uniref:Uncharacterized protein n=1 Tax=Luteolibacter flavescens TaxID=1859460 RepID=A0ABT3FT21_9BACT|nr:hypothetical protein [Luteolibacter flavescens]MCW1886135.1 hypothetical protein [Luteolibacter flavescens]
MTEAFGEVSSDEDFGYALRDFLDRFREQPDLSLITDEPALLEPTLSDGGHADAFLAATAAWLANNHRLRVPDWAKGSTRALAEPRFAARSHNLRMVLLQESPTEFRLRNLFVSANALSRA